MTLEFTFLRVFELVYLAIGSSRAPAGQPGAANSQSATRKCLLYGAIDNPLYLSTPVEIQQAISVSDATM